MPMSDPYTIVFWCADTSHVTAFAGAHLLQTGIDTANRGRLGDEIPIKVGVGVARRRPILSREVSARGILRARQPRITTSARFDYLLTFASGHEVSLSASLRNTPDVSVIAARDLLATLEPVSPNSMTKQEILGSFNRVARTPSHVSDPHQPEVNLREIAVVCQQLVAAFSR